MTNKLNAKMSRLLLLAVFCMVAMIIAASGYWVQRQETRDVRTRKLQDLKTIAGLKCNQIVAWRSERLADARLNASGIIQLRVLQWLRDIGNTSLKAEVLSRLEFFKQNEGYENLILAAPDGRLLIASDPGLKQLEAETGELARQAVASHQSVFGDFFHCPACKQVHLDIVSPILDETQHPVAALVLRTDPAQRLYPLIQGWPTSSPSAETLLVRRDGNDVLFLNALRYQPASPLTQRIPLSRKDVPAVQVTLGRMGTFEGLDYRGVPVLADLRPVPDSPWFMVSKMDKDEILAEAYYRAGVIHLLVLLGILMTGGLAAMLFIHRRNLIYQALLQAEQARCEAQEETRATFYGIGDGVIATDAVGCVTRMNPVASALTGWSEAEALGRPMSDVFRIINEETRADVENPVDLVLRQGRIVGLANHTLLIAKDGTERPIADHGAPIYNEKGDIIGVVMVFRDQSAERMAQAALLESEQRFRMLFDHMPLGYQSLDSNGYFLEVNPAWLELLGYEREEVIGHWFGDFLPPDYTEAFRQRFPLFKQAGEVHNEFDIKHKDGSIIHAAFDGRIGCDEKGQFKQTHCILRDITDRRRAETALQESEVKYRTLANSGQALIWTSGLDMKYDYFNQSWLAFTGRSLEQELGDGWMEGVHTDDLERCISVYTSAFDRRENFSMDYRLRRHDGEYHWIQNVGSPRYDHQGHFIGYIGQCLDITALKQAELQVTQSEERYRALFDRSLDAVYLHDLQGNFLDANPAALNALGYTRDEISSLNITSLLTCEQDRVRAAQTQHEVVTTGTQRDVSEYLLRRKDGTLAWFELMGSLVLKDGQPVAIQGIGRDITERKRAEESLLMTQFSVDHAADELYWMTRDSQIVTVNEAACRTLGYTRDELLRLTIPDIDPQYSPQVWHDFWESLQVQRTLVFETRHRHKSGRIIPVEITANYIEFGGKAYSCAFVRDITERKRAEHEQEKLQEQLLQSQKMESVGRLAGGVAHDFNNMLGVIIGHADMALTHVAPATPLHEALSEIQKAALRSADLTRQLLAFARKQAVSPKILDLNVTVASMLKMLQRLIGENIELVWNPGPELWSIKIDPSQVDQILANLAVNARDAIAGVGTLTIKTKNIVPDNPSMPMPEDCAPGDYVLLAISDTGAGMDEATMAHIFEPFFTTKDVGKGTGLGLAMVYGAVKQNNGCISVESEPGRGTTIKIYLPRAEAGEAATTPQRKPTQGTETVLLTEDEESILRLGTSILNKHGYTVLAARTPMEALKLAESYEGPIHLLITDVIMPEMNGRELKNRLKTLRPGIKVMFMSGYTSDVITHQGVLDEGVEFLQKPFTVNDLTQKVREVLRD